MLAASLSLSLVFFACVHQCCRALVRARVRACVLVRARVSIRVPFRARLDSRRGGRCRVREVEERGEEGARARAHARRPRSTRAPRSRAGAMPGLRVGELALHAGLAGDGVEEADAQQKHLPQAPPPPPTPSPPTPSRRVVNWRCVPALAGVFAPILSSPLRSAPLSYAPSFPLPLSFAWSPLLALLAFCR